MSSPVAAHAAPLLLKQAVIQMLPDAQLAVTRLPLCPDIQLWLLNGEVLNRPMNQTEQISIQEHPCYWAFCWASGHMLARYLLDHPELVKGKTVLDVGCGSGVVSIAAAMAGAHKVIACDLDRDALIATQANAVLNHVELEVLDDFCAWETNDHTPSVIIAADLLYDRSNLALVSAFLERSKEVMIADSRIRDFTHPAFKTLGAFASSNQPFSGGYDEFHTVNLYQSLLSESG